MAREQGAWVGLGKMGPINSGAALTTPFRTQLTLLLVLEDRLHRQLTYDLLPSRLVVGVKWWAGVQALTSATTHLSCVLSSADSAQDLAAELVHYGFLHEVGGGAAGVERCRVCRAARYYRASLPIHCRMTGQS